MLIVASCLWDPNSRTQDFSRGYDESWVDKLYRGFKRNLSEPFRFVLFTDRKRSFEEPVEQELLARNPPDYGCMIEPFRLDEPMILVGLDTIVVGNIDHMARYCLGASLIALPRDPYQPTRSINGVALVPRGHAGVATEWRGENDMEWLRRFPWEPIDDLWPGQVVSLKAHRVRDVGLQDARIVYFHGRPKPPALGHLPWVRENWK